MQHIRRLHVIYWMWAVEREETFHCRLLSVLPMQLIIFSE